MNNNQIFLKSKQVWEDNLKLFPQTKLQYPDENLVRLFSGRYVQVPQPPAKVMDHGFGSANTLRYLVKRGYECSGCEISNQFLGEAKTLFKSMGKEVDLRLVEGLGLPFENAQFDIVVSWNVIHYSGTRKTVELVLSELYRVLKPGGVLLLSTIHPDCSLVVRMRSIGGGSYIFEDKSEYDNRQGLTIFCARSSGELKQLFGGFSDVKTGYASCDLFNPEKVSAWFLFYAIK